MNFDLENTIDENFEELFNVNNDNGLINKDTRKIILNGMITNYLRKHTIMELAKVIADCVPMGYVARIIMKLRDNKER